MSTEIQEALAKVARRFGITIVGVWYNDRDRQQQPFHVLPNGEADLDEAKADARVAALVLKEARWEARRK